MELARILKYTLRNNGLLRRMVESNPEKILFTFIFCIGVVILQVPK